MIRNADVRKVMEELDKKEHWTAEDLDRAVASVTRDEDPHGFEFETLAEFSDTPLEFEEYARALMEDLNDIYYLTGTYNRFSPDYLDVCRLLEKIIKQLGSCCVTKAVLEKKGFTFRDLEDLSIDMLYRCISFNFRKCHAAAVEGRKKQILDINILNQECSFFILAERLRSTAEKIEKIRSGKISIDAMLERSTVFKPKEGSLGTKTRMIGTDRKAGSLPILGSVARQMIRARKDEEKEFSGYGMFRPAKPFAPMKLPPEWMTEEEKALAEKKKPRSKEEKRRAEAKAKALDREIRQSNLEFMERRLGLKVVKKDTEAKTEPEQGERKPLSYHPEMKKKKHKKKR